MMPAVTTLFGVLIALIVLWAALLLTLALVRPPIDLIPDFIPIIGYADDAIISYLVLRSILRAAGPDVIAQHWPGSPEGPTAVQRLLGRD